MPAASDISEKQLRKLYETDCLTTLQTAHRLGISPQTVHAYRKKFGIPARKRKITIPYEMLQKFQSGELTVKEISKMTGTDISVIYDRLKEHGIRPPGRRIDLPRDMLVKMYVDEKMAADQIADRMGVGKHLVYRNLERYGIPKRPTNSEKRMAEPDKQTLEQMYVQGRMTVPDIGRELGCSKYTVYRCLEKHGIRRRKSGPLLKQEITERELRLLYEERWWSTKRVAEHFGVRPHSIVPRLHKFGITVRGRRLTGVLTRDLLERLYVKDGRPAEEIAETYNTLPDTVNSYLKRFGLFKKRRDYSSPHYARRRQSKKDAEGHVAEMKDVLGGRCIICGQRPPAVRALSIHHIWYVPDDVVHDSYASGHQDEYHNDLYPLVVKEPRRFCLLCPNHHSLVGKYHTYPGHKRRNLLKAAQKMSTMRMRHPTTYDSLLAADGSSENGDG